MPRLKSAPGHRRRSVDPVIARRRAMVLRIAGLMFLVAVTADLVWKAMHVA